MGERDFFANVSSDVAGSPAAGGFRANSVRAFGRALCGLYRSRGYRSYRMNKFEPYDLYARNRSFLTGEDILTFTDTDGRLMALKPDVTISIVKDLPESGGMEKVYYNENVYHTAASSGFREIPQAGLECIGKLDLYTMGEVLTLAALSLRLISPVFLLDLGHMGFFDEALEGVGEPLSSELFEAVVRKNRSAVLSLCAKGGIDARRTEMLRTLSELYDVPSAALPRLESLGWSGAGRDALAELRVLTDILISQGFGDDLRIDFSSVSRLKYYNGPVFFGSLPGVPESVLSGGRYDPLLARMGKSGGAIGFAVYLDRLERFCEAPSGPDGDLLLLYDDDDDPVRVSLLAENLAETGGVIRVCRTAPEGLVFRRTLRFKEAVL